MKPFTQSSRLLLLTLTALLLGGCRVVWISPTTSTLADNATEAQLPAEIADSWAIVETTINGHGPYRLILDTGAVYGLLSTELAESLGVEPSFDAWITDSGGIRAKYRVGLADEAVSGPLTLTRVPFVISDNIHDLLRQCNADGILGYPGFDRLTLDLDYPAGAVRVSTQRLHPSEPGAIPLRRIRNETPKVRVAQIQNDRPTHSRWMAIDSGGSMFISFDANEESRWTHTHLASSPRTASGLAGNHPYRVVPLRGDLLIAGTRITGATAQIDAPNNLIGHQLLRHFRVRIDNRGGLATLTPADPAADTVALRPPGTLGITQVVRFNEAYLILSIARESPAERAGLLPNDLVFSIDGVPVVAGAALNLKPDHDAPPVVLTVDRDDIMIDLTLTPTYLFPPDRTVSPGPDRTIPGVRLVTTGSVRSLEIDTPEGTISIPAAPETAGP